MLWLFKKKQFQCVLGATVHFLKKKKMVHFCLREEMLFFFFARLTVCISVSTRVKNSLCISKPFNIKTYDFPHFSISMYYPLLLQILMSRYSGRRSEWALHFYFLTFSKNIYTFLGCVCVGQGGGRGQRINGASVMVWSAKIIKISLIKHVWERKLSQISQEVSLEH